MTAKWSGQDDDTVKCATCGTVWVDYFTLTRTEIVKWRGEK